MWHIIGSLSHLFLLLLFLIGCSPDEAPLAPTETFNYATIVEVKAAKTYKGDDADHLWWDRKGLKYWHAEIDVVFSQTPTDLELLDISTKHFLTDNHNRSEHPRNHESFKEADWEQTGNIVTIYLTFHASALFHGNMDYAPMSYESAKEEYPDIDWKNFTVYTIGFTLDWDTGRKRIEGIPIKPAPQILDRFRASK